MRNTVLIAFLLEDHQREYLDLFAQRCGISRSEAIRIALTEYPNVSGHEDLQGKASMLIGGYCKPELHDALTALAASEGISVSAIARARVAALLVDAGWGLAATSRSRVAA